MKNLTYEQHYVPICTDFYVLIYHFLVTFCFPTLGKDRICGKYIREAVHLFPEFNDDLTGLRKASILSSLQRWKSTWRKRPGMILTLAFPNSTLGPSSILSVNSQCWVTWIQSNQMGLKGLELVICATAYYQLPIHTPSVIWLFHKLKTVGSIFSCRAHNK